MCETAMHDGPSFLWALLSNEWEAKPQATSDPRVQKGPVGSVPAAPCGTAALNHYTHTLGLPAHSHTTALMALKSLKEEWVQFWLELTSL